MFFNENLLLQVVIVFILFLFKKTTNPLVFIYLSGFYLFSISFLILSTLSTVFIGFLWVIDLGLGIIAILAVLILTKLFYFKAYKHHLSFIYFLLCCCVYIFFMVKFNVINDYILSIHYPFLIYFINYYLNFQIYNFSELHLIRYIYFYNNISEFSIINMFLFYAICFVLSFFFNFFWFKQILRRETIQKKKLFNNTLNTNFMRTQNFTTQLTTSTGLFFWKKK